MIQADNLCKTFHPPRGEPVHAVRDATFAVAPGEIFGLLGPNGAGKTTLLRMLGTIIKPSQGRCRVADQDTQDRPEQVRRSIGFLSGNTRLYGRLTVREMLRYFGRLYGLDDTTIVDQSAKLADLLEMNEFLNRRCDSLSTGQTQRASIARVILHDPPVLILDEPTLGLDIMSSRTIISFIKQARAQGRSIIFSTHYMTEAELLCDRIGFIFAGRLMAIGTQQELYERTRTDNLQDAFLAMAEGAQEAQT